MMISNTATSMLRDDKAFSDNSYLEEYTRQLREKYSVNNRLLFVQTLQFQLDAFNLEVAKNRGYYAYPPTGIQWLIKALGQRVEASICDLNYQLLKHVIEEETFNYFDWLDILDEHIEKFNPSIIGVTCIGVSTDLFKPNHPLTEVLQHLKRRDKHIVIIGGPVATDEFKNYLNCDLCHFVIKNEGENKINFLFDYLLAEKPSQTPTTGINFKFNGRIEESSGEEDKVFVRGNLIDSYQYVPIENYHKAGSLNPFSRMVGQDVRFAGIQLNRGCRANCRFCGVAKFMGKNVRQASVRDVYDEMVYLIEEKGVRHFELLDDDFVGSVNLRDGVTELLEKMCYLKERWGITWSAGNGLIAGSITENLMRLMNDSGCIGFRIGLESGNQEILKKMRKPASVKSSKLFAMKIQKYPDMFVSANYIIGLYGEETFGQMLDTYKLSCELNLDWSSYSTFQFTSKTTSKMENLKDDKRGASECIPTKDSANREIQMTEGLEIGLDIFNIPKDTVPSREQIAEIWFVFNLLSNYINNKNLKPKGRPDKLVAWIEALQVTYPKNAYMPLFAGLAYILLDMKKSAIKQWHKAKDCVNNSDYWRRRFQQFDLIDLVQNFPQTENEVYEKLHAVQKRISDYEESTSG